MKKFFYATLCVVSLCLSGCGYDDDEVWNAINDQEERIAALEEWQKTANENIAALQAIVNGNDYITSVEEIKEGDEIIGYTINFHRQGEVTIYNGKDGEKGDMPVIGVSEGEDGRWYWTLNGELLEDADGNPVCANGKDGEDGEDGEDGADGSSSSSVTPMIKLGSDLGEGYNEYASYISVDGGRTWTQINVPSMGFGSVLEKIEAIDDYYVFYFSENKFGYSSSIQIPKYAGLKLQYQEIQGEWIYYDSIKNGVLSVNTGKKFTIYCEWFSGGNLDYTLTNEDQNTEWKITEEKKGDGSIYLNFDAIENPGTATLKLTLISSNNEVTYYQVEITAEELEKIEGETNEALVNALVNAGFTANADGDIELTSDMIVNTTSLYLAGSDEPGNTESKITSLAGLEVFENLEKLNCPNNAITEINLEDFPNLTTLDCSNNQIFELDLTKAPNLTSLNCSNNPLTSLDVTEFPELITLNCDNCFNQSSASRSYSNGVLDLSENTKLQTLSCADNGLTGLILPDTETLTEINCDNNQLTGLDVSKNTSLRYLFGNGNKFTSLNVSNNTLLWGLEIRNNALTDINLSTNENLMTLAVHGNQLTVLDVSKNGDLEYLFCGNNRLTSLDVSSNGNLIYLNCLGNQLQTLDISKNTRLEDLYCYDQTGTLYLVINEDQQALWESIWKNNNYNVVVSDESIGVSGGSGSNFGNGGVY